MYNKICYLPSAVLALFCTLSIGAIVGSETLAQTAENAATVITPAPVIHLADNLDEADGLGWCIDTVGRGFNTALQVHSCKPQGGDVQFSFDTQTGQLRSVAFDGYCVSTSAAVTTDLGLVDCAANDLAQRFSYAHELGTISPDALPAQCITAGATSRSAGPFMSRDLLLADCAETPSELTRWIIVN